MEISRIFQLLDAGYTREQIEAYEKGMNDTGHKDEPKQEKITENIEPKTEQENELENNEINALKEQIVNLTKTIQEMNVKNDTFKNDTRDIQTRADDILSQMWGIGGK